MSTNDTSRDGVLSRILGWLRQGYPQGVPPSDYVALLGILNRALTEAEISSVVRSLAGEDIGQDDDADERIRAEIHRQILLRASDEDVARVSARLAAAGWPLASGDVAY